MGKLVFRVASDWQEVVRLRTEIEKLKQTLLSMDKNRTPSAVAALESQLGSARQRMNELVTEAAKAGAEMENGFKKGIYDGEKAVNSLSEEIIKQKNIIRETQNDVSILTEQYKKLGKYDPKRQSLSDELNRAKVALGEQKYALGELQSQQGLAKLSTKALKDEYALFKDESKAVINVNDGVEVSFKKTLAAIGGTAMLKKFVSDIVRVRGQFQQLDVAFTTLLQSKEKANALMGQMVETAAKTPFNLTELVTGAKQLVAYGFASEGVNDTLIRLGNIASGLGLPLERLTYLYGTTMTQGRLYARDLMQFTTSGIPMLQGLADMYGKSTDEVNKMVTSGKIGFPEVQKVIENMTNEGGKFYNLMEEQSKTITGKISNLGDAWDEMLNKIGQSNEGVINGSIDGVKYLVENYETVGKILTGLVATYGTYKAATIAYYAITKTYGVYDIATKELQFATTMKNIVATKAMTVQQALLNATMLKNPYVLAAVAVVGLVAAMWALHDSTTAAERIQQRYNKAIEDQSRQLDELKSKTNSLVAIVKDENSTQYDKVKAYKQLQSLMPKIFSNMDIEALKLINILSLNKQISEELNRRERIGAKTNVVLAQQKYDRASSRYQQSVNEGNMQSAGFDKKKMEDAKIELEAAKKVVTDITKIQAEANKQKDKEDKKVIVKNKEHWTNQKKEAETALESIASSQKKLMDSGNFKGIDTKVVESYKKNSKLLKEAENELKVYDSSSKQESAAEKLRKQAESLRAQQEKYDLLMDKQKLDRKRIAEDLENQATQASIDAKADGFVKIQAQRELDNKKEIQALERQKEDYIRAMIQAEKDKFDAKEELNEKSIKGYKRKTFDSSTVTVDTSKWDKIIKDTETKQGLNEWEQREASMNEYLLKYGTFSQKKEVIDKKYRDAIEKETDLGTKNTLKKEWEEATSALDMDKLKQGINWELIFGDLSKVSKKSLEEVKGQLRTFKSSPEYNNMTVEQKKVVDESLNNIQTTIIDKGGLLGDLPEQLDALRIAQKELTEAQEEYDKAMKNGTEAQQEAALKKKNAAQQGVTNAETNVTKAKDKTVTNLIALSDSITQLGGSSEMSLSQIGNLAENITNVFAEAGSKIGGIIGAAFSLLDVIDKQGFDVFVENIFSSVFNAARGVLDTITFGAFSKITGSGDSDKNLEKDLEALAQSNEDLKNSLDNLSEKMDKASVTDASDIYEVQKENLKKLESNTLESMQRSAAAYNNGFMGIGGSHSSSNKIDNGISASEWSRISEIVGSSVQNAGQFFQLSSEQMAKLAEEDTTLYSKIKDLANDGYKDAAQYMDEYITYYKQLEELENAYNEKLTNTSFDSVRDEFKNALLDMESDVEDFAANFEKMMQNAIVESLMTKKYDKLIQEWYGKFAKAMEGDGTIDENEQRDLKKDWNDIVNQGIAERNALKDAMGWDNGSSYSEESSKRNFASMSQDTGNELNGRFTAFQISNEEIKNQSIQQTGLLSSINEKMSLLNLTNKDIPALTSGIPNIADQSRESIMNSYHPQINVIFPDAKIDVLTTEISSLRNTVVDMQRMQAEGLLDGKDIMSNTGVLAKNSPKILSNTDEMKRDIKNAL